MAGNVSDTLEAEVQSATEDVVDAAVVDAPEVVTSDGLATTRTLPLLAETVEQIPVYRRGKRERLVRWIILGSCTLIFLPNLGSFGLWDPWETHYGAVTTEMLDTYDWISPWWGHRDKIGDESPQGKYFYSKPIFIFWTEAIAARVIGRGEWSLRLPMALLAIISVFLAYLALSKIWTRRVGVFGALILATSPQFFMMSRQAQTDMPFVATMFMGLLFAMLALFGRREPMDDKKFKRWTLLTIAFVLLNTLPQYGLLISDLDDPVPGDKSWLSAAAWMLGRKGWAHAIYYIVILGVVFESLRRQWRREADEGSGAELSDAFKDRWLRRYYLIAAFIMFAQSTYAKGLMGFMLPGAVLVLYLAMSWNWRILGRILLGRGAVIFFLTCLPWYVAMLTRHGKPYWDRFFVHDHFNRIGEGVHQIDSGTFEHFIRWLGIGMWPWVAFVPLALFWMLRQRARDNEGRNQARLFAGAWFLLMFSLFTLSSTKFHHYIFPAMPALAIIVAIFIDYLFKESAWMARLATVVGAVIFVSVGMDIYDEPQQIRRLMTYKYERPMPAYLPLDAEAPVSSSQDTYTWEDSYFYKHTSPTLQSILQTDAFEYKTFIRFLLIAGVVALCLFFMAKTRMVGLAALGLLASMLAVWCLNYYMPMLSPHWSQKYIFDAYYDTCTQRPMSQETEDAFTPLLDYVGLSGVTQYLRGEYKTICEEDVITWLITWRGETYYSWNETKPIADKGKQFVPYLRDYNHGKKFYVLIERGKHLSLKSTLTRESDALKKEGVQGFKDISDWKVKVEGDENKFFQMVSATPVRL